MTLLILALLIGLIAGLRAMTAPAAVAFAAWSGALPLAGSVLAFLGYSWTPWILALLAVGELITDQLPSTPSRKVPVQFGTRLLTGGLAGAAFGIVGGSLIVGVALGVIGAIIGTFAGAAARGRLAAAFGQDLPAALIEDAVAVLGAFAIVALL